MHDQPRTAITLAVLSIFGVESPLLAPAVSLIAFAIAMHALRQVNCVVKQLEERANEQADEISELVADPLEGGGIGGG